MRGLPILLLFLFAKLTFAQQQEVLDVQHIRARIDLDFEQEKVHGKLDVAFIILKDTDSVYLDAKNLDKYKVQFGGRDLNTDYTGKHLVFKKDFAAGQKYIVNIMYTATPDQALYFVNNEGSKQMWTQGQGKYTSNWLPSIDDTNDKIEFDLTVTAPAELKVVANGNLMETRVGAQKSTWVYNMDKPMSSYLVAIVAGDYRVWPDESFGGVKMEYYYYPKDSLKRHWTYRNTREIMDFLEGEIGVKYPWQNYKQVPVKDFLYAGMENTTATVFSDQFMVNRLGYIDRNYTSVDAHEMAHQWFGNLVTATSGEHHWLQEGFATYYALLAEGEIFGNDYYYEKLIESAEQLSSMSEKGNGEALVSTGASSLTYYQKGAWALHMLREKMGNPAFQETVKTYLNTYAYDNASTEDFLEIAKQKSGTDLSSFADTWLYQKEFPTEEAMASLQKSEFVNDYFEAVALREKSFWQKRRELSNMLTLPNDFIGQEAIFQLAEGPISSTLPIYQKAFYTNNPYIRQAIAKSVQKVPAALRLDYERLLRDDSYLTQEIAFQNLWSSFPYKRHEYLDKMKGVNGFADHNLEILWLGLAIGTLDYEESQIRDHYARLTKFTEPQFAVNTRLNAFQKLYQIRLFDQKSFKNLVAGCVHFNWRYSQSCRQILESLLEDEEWVSFAKQLSGFTQKERNYLDGKLD
ncbi:MAG: M1 family metallopeptidase [Leeuwenhoekiella sp.]